MKIILATVAVLVLGTVSASAASAADKPMNYDCTKAGNKNKAACKGAAPAAAAKPAAMAAAPKPAAMPKAAANTAAAPAKAAKPMTYDCSKAGNKNKAACKGAIPTPPPAVAMKPVAPPVAAKPLATPAAKPLAPVAAAKPLAPVAAAAAPVRVVRTPKAPAPVNPNLVAATLKNGKVVHYDCSKAGNRTKTACKK